MGECGRLRDETSVSWIYFDKNNQNCRSFFLERKVLGVIN